MNSTANDTLVSLFSTPYKAPPGMYWGASLFDGAAQPYIWSNNSAVAPNLNFYGQATMRPYVVAGVTFATGRLIETATYSGGFPANAAPAYGANNPASPVVGFLAGGA